MHPTLEKWIAALRSGEYKQTKNTLCDDNGGYCCLGVLEHIISGDVERVERDGYEKGKAFGIISHEFAAAHGIDRFNMFGSGYSVGDLANYNDHGMSFAEIADRLEGKL